MALFVRDHRVALLDLTGPDDRVRLVGGRLPDVEGRWPTPSDLARAAGDPDALVAGPATREPDGSITNVLLGSGRAGPDGTWVVLGDLTEAHGVRPPARAALLETARVLRGGEVADGRAAWFRPGWLADATGWIDRTLAGHGLERVGSACPVKLWSLSAVLRVRVRDASGAHEERDVWFKETCEGFRTEAGLTAAVAHLAPDVAPRVLAVDTAGARLLLEEIDGAADDTDPALAPAIAARLVALQQDTHPELDVLRAAGAPDRGLDATLDGVRRVLTDSVELPLMTVEQRARLPELGAWVAEVLTRFWSHGLPDVLGHGDLHLGNVAWIDDSPVFFDWTDLCVTHPFLDAWHLATSAANDADDPAVGAAVREVVGRAWAAARPGVDVDAAWADTDAAEAAFLLVTYEDLYLAQPEVSRWELSRQVVLGVERLLALMDAERAGAD
jgi:hypothetical protein